MTTSLLDFLRTTEPTMDVWDYVSASRLNLWSKCPLVDPLTGEDLGLPLVGIIDLLLETPDGLMLVDFKTAASASSNCEILHELQLTAYSYLIRQLLDRDESALEIRQLVKTKTPKVVVHRFPPRTDEHFRRFFDLVREYLDHLDRGVFNYRPGFGCMMCDQTGICSVS